MHKGTKGMIMWLLVIAGAINWGLVGLGGFLGRGLNVLNLALGSWPEVEWAVYILIGLAGVKMLFWKHKK